MTMQATETAPIEKTVIVPLPVEKAFHMFTGAMDMWWPFAKHSIEGEQVETVIIEGREGGRWYERTADGTEHDWGTVRTWDPPNRFAVDWHVTENVVGSELEISFTPEDGSTRVELEHRGWEKCAPAARASYDTGWEFVLGRFVEAA